MTRLERAYLEYTLAQCQGVTATAATYDFDAGKIESGHTEAARLLESDDYRAGWQACHERITSYIECLLAGDRRVLRKALPPDKRP